MWWKDAIIYEVYVDKFSKDFKGLAGKLPYLKNLGINTIWLLPHYPSPMVDDGYDVSDYLSVRHELGTLGDFKIFIEKAHEHGIRVIIDLVLNHVSTEHSWFREASRSKDNKYRDYFLWSKKGDAFKSAKSPFRHFVLSHWTYNQTTDDYYFSTYYSQQADLNWDNPEVFKEIMAVIDFWIDLGVDGFRLDAISHIIKRENTECFHLPEIHPILRKIRNHIDRKHQDVILLAEASGKIEDIIKYFGDGDECHMVFNFPLMSNFYLAFKRKDPKLIEDMTKRSADIPNNCQWATFISNHDEITFSSFESPEQEEMVEWLNPGGEYSFKGGWGVSMRLATVFNGDKKRILEFFKTFINAPGSPVIYYGSEIGMKNLELAEKPIDTRKYVRGSFDWREADKEMADPDSIFNHIKEIIRARKAS